MVVVPGDLAVAEAHLHPDVELVPAALDDAWMRDIGPTFVRSADGTRLGAVDWVFNGWGAQSWATWEHDARIGAFVGGLAGAEVIGSSLVNEGGGIHVDGLGTVLLTETVQLDPGRNPGLTRADVEAELARTIGATHVRLAAARPDPRLRRVRHPWPRRHRGHDREPGRRAAPRAARPRAPRPRRLPRSCASCSRTPVTRGASASRSSGCRPRARSTDAEGPVDWSYINHLVVNDGVIACTFGDEQDDASLGGPRRRVPGSPGRRGRRAAALRPRRRHPLHHPAAARPLTSSAHVPDVAGSAAPIAGASRHWTVSSRRPVAVRPGGVACGCPRSSARRRGRTRGSCG